MKTYIAAVDRIVTQKCIVKVLAKTEEEAKQIACAKAKNDITVKNEDVTLINQEHYCQTGIHPNI